MTPACELVFLLFSHLILTLLPLVGGDGSGYEEVGDCPPSFKCGYLQNISFPFTTVQRKDCGLLAIQNCDDPRKFKTIQLQNKGKYFEVIRISQHPHNSVTPAILIRDNDFYKLLQSRSCEAFRYNYTLPSTPSFHFGSFRIEFIATFFKCNRTLHVRPPTYMLNYSWCPDFDLYYFYNSSINYESLAPCTKVQLPIKDVPDAADPFTFITADIFTDLQLSDECANWHYSKGGQCQFDTKKFCCANVSQKKKWWSWKVKLGIGLCIGILGISVTGSLVLLLLFKRIRASSIRQLQTENSYSGSSSNPQVESGGVYFEVPIFSYKDLKEATNNFDRTKEVGDGGFGTVYYGKLQDGREVAVKRLYEHNYRRVEQFMNEVKILTRLRHTNLVTLYGCTSRHSRELILVYEYLSNGTVACHLHGGLAKPLPWSIRMKIAIETASALAYLHASDIIHRDVKSSNILLTHNYTVKVADFGLSRLFPNDVTHVSTAPQGTPGYVDPEYHQCYQLTSKSDVYSFGVVLIELISSKPAVDINRSKEEINLSNLAIKKIQQSAISELLDPSLGFDSDSEAKRMIVSVAELAFQCLQRDKELRPSMDQVLDELRKIEGGKDKPDVADGHSNPHPSPPTSPEWDEVELLKNMKLPSSPNTVTEKWESKYTTPDVSG